MALCKGPRTRKGPHAMVVVAATDDGSIDQPNQLYHSLGRRITVNKKI